jgi:hypothetical protein
VRRFLSRLVDGADTSVAQHIVLGFAVLAIVAAFQGYALVGLHQPWNGRDFGEGLGLALGGVAAFAFGQGKPPSSPPNG